MCAWALSFPWIGKWGAIALGIVAVLFNALLFPRLAIGRRVAREEDGRWTGVQWYPVAVLGLVIALPLPLAAGAWGILGAGDAASNLVGRRLGTARLPWNCGKSWAGTAAFLLAAAPVAFLLMRWNDGAWPGGEPGFPALATAALAGAAAGAAVETIPWRIDDNLTVAASAGIAIFFAAHAG